jgi:hypothetical protein
MKFNMLRSNSAATPDEAEIKLRKDIEEPFVDVTLYRNLIGSLRLRYLCFHTRYLILLTLFN